MMHFADVKLHRSTTCKPASLHRVTNLYEVQICGREVVYDLWSGASAFRTVYNITDAQMHVT